MASSILKSPAAQEAIQVFFFDHYLVKWRLDSWTSISLLLKSLSSLRMAACRGERKREKSCRGSADKQHTLSLLACFMHHLGLRPRQGLSHHKTPGFSPADI